jgi:hypothetical protein
MDESSPGFMKDYIKMLNVSFGGFVHECPYKGEFRIVNAAFDHSNKEYISSLRKIQIFPNGKYKITVKVHNKKDENIGSMILHSEVYTRENHLNSYDNL